MTNSAIPGLVIADPVTSPDPKDATKSYVSVKMLTLGKVMTQNTASVPNADAAKLTANLVKGNLVGYVPANLKTGEGVVVPSDPAMTFYKVLAKGATSTSKNSVQFDSMKYGPELQPIDGVPGKMVAAGWIYAKTKNSVTVGDGRIVTVDMMGRAYDPALKRYEETYKLANDVAVYNVNTDDYTTSKVSSLADLPVTKDYDYATTTRQAVYIVFDKNFRNVEAAKVIAIYFFTPQSTSDGKPVWDVPTQSPMLSNSYLLAVIGPKDPVSNKPWVEISASGVTQAAYSRSTEPFEMVKNTMYFVGDNEVAVYLLNADMGTPGDKSDDKLIMLDAGWPNSGYQYWKNIEAVGFDPRNVTDWWGTHGHGDHYGTAVELATMVENGGGAIQFWGSKQDTFGVTSDLQGNVWNISGALPASETEIRGRTTKTYDFDKWYDFGNVQIYVTWSPGHTAGTTNMLFKVKNPIDGKWITFGYHGGYGYNGLYTPTVSNGWLRLDFQHGFSYLQQNFTADYVSPQHTNQYPIVDAYQALKAYNRDPANANAPLTLLDALVSKMPDSPGLMTSEFVNQLEKRRSVVSYKASDTNNSAYKSLETSGPFKPGRENGLAAVKATLLDDGKIIQGFNGYQNKNPKIPLLKDGLFATVDSYTHDPGGFYVQFYIDVQDRNASSPDDPAKSYKGYLPNNFSQYSPGMGKTIVYAGGPVESIHAATGTYHPPEVLRTQRVDSLAKAQAILASVKKNSTYTISLTAASEIVVPEDVTKTFQP